MASQKQLQRAAAKTAAAIKTQAIQTSAWANLQNTLRVAGITLSLSVLGCNVSAQQIQHSDKRPQTHKSTPKIELRGITGEFYTLKTGEVCEVWLAPDGRKYIYRPNGRKYYPKSLNK